MLEDRRFYVIPEVGERQNIYSEYNVYRTGITKTCLYNYDPLKHEMSVLLRGLKFTPTPDKSNDEQLSNDIAEFH